VRHCYDCSRFLPRFDFEVDDREVTEEDHLSIRVRKAGHVLPTTLDEEATAAEMALSRLRRGNRICAT
jgi:hypothetical protein